MATYKLVLAENSRLNSQKNQPSVTFNSQVSGSLRAPCGRSSSAARAGLKVSELNAEMIVETAMVRANCRKN